MFRFYAPVNATVYIFLSFVIIQPISGMLKIYTDDAQLPNLASMVNKNQKKKKKKKKKVKKKKKTWYFNFLSFVSVFIVVSGHSV